MKNRNICKLIAPNVGSGLTIYNLIFETNSETMVAPSALEHHRMFLVTEGGCEFIFDGKPVRAGIGDLVVGFQDESIAVRPNDGCAYMYISFDGTRSDSILGRFGIDRSTRTFSGFEGLIPLWKNSLSAANELTMDLAAEGLLLYTFSHLTTEAAKRQSAVGQVQELTKERFTDPGLTITGVAEWLSYNPKYLSHLFKREVGVNYSEYLRNMRLQYAIALFDNGLYSVKNAALLAGFTDPLYFSSVFKKSIGVSPKGYLKTKVRE